MSSFETKEYGRPFAKGLVRDKAKHEAFKAAAPKHPHVRGAITVPGVFSVGDKTSPCENQANCGSCWDFSVTKALRSSHMLAGHDPNRLSFMYLLLNVGPVHEYGCNGGDFDAGQNMLNGQGPCAYDLAPYTANDNGSYPKSAKVAATAKRWVLVGDGRTAPTAQQLVEALYNNGRGNYLSVDVAADGPWEGYSSGIYSHSGSTSINHMINMVGYNAETSVDASGNAAFNPDGSFKNGDGYFIVRNNWGASWGESGDMRTRWGCNAIAETAMYFEVELPVLPTVKVTVPAVATYGQDVRVDVIATNAASVICAGQVLPPTGGTFLLPATVLGDNIVTATATAADGTKVVDTAKFTVLPTPPPPPPASDSKTLWIIVGGIVLAALGVVVGLLIK